MPLTTNLNQNPYWADFSTQKSYYDVLFKPGVSVQTRELNNIQLQLQSQIEKFGDNVFTSGTIVSGCNFQFFNPYPYIKLNDLDAFNQPVVPITLVGLTALDPTTGLSALVLNYANGYQTTDPNLKTLYLKYNNTGNTGTNTTSFSPGTTLTLYNSVINGITQVNVVDGGTAFTNNDIVVAVSQLQVVGTAGPPQVGGYLSNGNGLTNVEIVTSVSLPGGNSTQYVIQVKPLPTDLANAASNSQFWSFALGDNLTNPSHSTNFVVQAIVGTGFAANVITNSVGTITSIVETSTGVAYAYLPFITVQSTTNNINGYSTLSLQAQNFQTQLIVASTANAVGNGYAFGVTQGIIYQKGYFVDVSPQIIVVEPYNTDPDQICVGFVTNEQIINYNIDTSLLDNANGVQNYQAPGADRMQLSPQLVVISASDANANNEFLTIVQWTDGNPYLQNQQTVYSTVGATIAQIVDDIEGDFVVSPFAVTTESCTDQVPNAEFFTIVVDPGLAYISGYRVATQTNYFVDDNAGTDTYLVNNHTISLNYGNYFVINNMAGSWSFNTGDQVTLWSAEKQYYSNNAPGNENLNPLGTQIGTANMRSLVLYDGQPGLPSTQYALYLFNVQMNAGQSLAAVESVAYQPAGANLAIADVVLSPSATLSGNNIAQLQDTNLDQLVFPSGVDSLKNANQVTYTYRTCNSYVTVANGDTQNASITLSIASGPETFPYGSGTLSDIQLQDFIITPVSGDMVYVTASVGSNATVNAAAYTGNNFIIGSGTSFLSNLTVGDWVYITANSTGGHALVQVNSIVNNSFLTLNSNVSFSNAAINITRVFPNAIPIPFGFRTALNANVNGAENQIVFNFGQPFAGAGTANVSIAYNVERSNYPSQSTKTANRQQYVMIDTANSGGGTTGPWSLGVPDVFRLNAVYIGSNSTTVSNSGSNYVTNFYVDPNQNVDFLSLSNLVLSPSAGVELVSGQYLLVCFDYFSISGVGYFDTVSYVHSSDANTLFTQDSLPYANLVGTGFCNSLEVPEIFDDFGDEIDLLKYIDFRPLASNTCLPTANSQLGACPVNPANTVTLTTTGEKKFPLPDSNFICNLESWMGRIDSLFLNQTAQFAIVGGKANPNVALMVVPQSPTNALRLVDMVIPPYPTLPTNLSPSLTQILQNFIVSNQGVGDRVSNQTVYNLNANSSLPYNQPTRFTQADIGVLAAQVAQLQYYETLSQLEANSASQTIASSVDPAENRQAYGIFTDNFTTSDFSALNDPEYAALYQPPNIVPPKLEWDIQALPANMPYIDWPIINQDVATIVPGTPGPVCALNLANTVAYTMAFRTAEDLTANQTVDVVNITMANAATIFDTIVVANGTVTQAIQQSQYNPYSAFYSSAVGVASGFNYLKSILNSFGLGGRGYYGSYGTGPTPQTNSYDYNPATQTLVIFTGTPNATGDTSLGSVTTITGIPPNIASLFGQAFLGQITWAQFFGSLNQTSSIAAGGQQVVGGNYYPPVSFYFYNYAQGTRYDIYQGNTIIASTDPTLGLPTAVDLTSSDQALLLGSATQYWFDDFPNLYMQPFQQLSSGAVSYAGKIQFNYNPTLGGNFSVVSTESPGSVQWRWALAYPIAGASVGCVPPPPTVVQATLSNLQSVTPIYSTYAITSQCGNGAGESGTINILTGFSVVWNVPQIVPQTKIVAFDSSQDWA